MFSQLFNFKDELCINYSFLVLNFKLRESAEKKLDRFCPLKKNKKRHAQIPNL